MGVKVSMPAPAPDFGSKLLGLGLTALTGGAAAPLLGGTGTLGAIGKIGGVLGGIKKVTDGVPTVGQVATQLPNLESSYKMPELGESAISRRLGSYSVMGRR